LGLALARKRLYHAAAEAKAAPPIVETNSDSARTVTGVTAAPVGCTAAWTAGVTSAIAKATDATAPTRIPMIQLARGARKPARKTGPTGGGARKYGLIVRLTTSLPPVAIRIPAAAMTRSTGTRNAR